jgi:superfamily II DNA or RNA helicase
MSALRPRPHQVAALADITRAHGAWARCQLLSPTGTGKGFTGRWYAQEIDAVVTVVFAPTLALIAQTLGDWRRASDPDWQFKALVVCSDPTTAAGAAERAEGGGSIDRRSWHQVAAGVTTSPVRAAGLLRAGGRIVVFSTYHSAPVVAAACAASGAAVDLMVCDEAHHLAGHPQESFRVVLDDRAIPSRRRLFMTATPQIIDGDDVLSMDDVELFGPVAHAVTYAQAIRDGLIADYQVLVIADQRVPDGRQPLAGTRDAMTVPGAVLAAAASQHLRSMLSFHTYVRDAEAFAALLDGIRLRNGRTIRARRVSGRQSGAQRAAALTWLGEDTGGRELRLISSARALVEGVDVPEVDSVLFADPRKSVVGIIQAVGRALRTADGKKVASVIVPVRLPYGGDEDTDLTASEFGAVWTVLRALRAHDERFAAELDDAAGRARGGLGGARAARNQVPRVKFLLPDGASLDEDLLRLRMVEAVTFGDSSWERFYSELLDYARATSGGYLPFNKTWNGVQLGQWAMRQIAARKAGMLPASRAARLEAVPGWAWSREDGHWREDLRRLRELAKSRPDGLAQPAGSPSIYVGLKDSRRLPLGYRAAEYRQLYRDNMLTEEQVADLEALPGWDPSGGLPHDDVAMVQALRVYCEFAHHADVPEAHQDGNLPLGRWVVAVRRRKLTGRLHPALEEEIAAATPRGRKGEPTFRWLHNEAQWRLAYAALRQYVGREGTAANIPPFHVEKLPDAEIQLGQWSGLQRYRKRHALIDPQQKIWLDQIPGWDWDPAGRRQEYGEPLDLGDDRWHGRPKGITAGCKCERCLNARRVSDRRHAQRREETRMARLGGAVSAGPARRHLARLEHAGAKRGQLTDITGVPLGVIRKVANGTTDLIGERHDRLLRAVTVEMIRTAPNTRTGSRGRAVSKGGERIPAGPTRALLEDLKARGFGSTWVARELGYATSQFSLGSDSGMVTRRVADQVAALHSRVGHLMMQRSRRNEKVPRLAELLNSPGSRRAG